MRKGLLLLISLLVLSHYAQLPLKIDSLIPVYEKLKDDTFKVDRLLWIATNTSGVDTAVSGKYGRMGYALALKLNDDKSLGNSFNYFGTRHYYTQNYDKAIACFEKSAEYFNKCGFLKGSASALNNCGVILNEKGDFKRAIEFQKKAMEVNAKAKNEEGVGNNYLNMGNTYNITGDYKTAMDHFIKAEGIFSKLKSWESLATAYYNMGYVNYNLRQYEKAFEYNRKSLRIREEKTGNKIGMAYNHVFFGAVYGDTAIREYNKANFHYKKVVELCEETGDRITQLSALVNIGRNYASQGFKDSAVFYAKKSLLISKEIGNGKFIITSLFNLGEALLSLSPKEALGYFKEGYDLAIAAEDNNMIASNADGISKAYFGLKQYKEAYEYMMIYSKKKDNMFSQEMLTAVKDMEAKYETEKKDLQIKNQSLEISAQEKENNAKTKVLIIGTIGLFAVVVFAFVAFRNFKKTQKANIIINNQKEQVELQKEEIEHQKLLVEEKQKEILDSIHYAQKIQAAVLTGDDVWKKISQEHFILFQPKDIVSGDFYWAYNTVNSRAVFALADCTGHGVPGGFMSMLGNSFLNELVVENKIFNPAEILNKLRTKIISSLEQKGVTDRRDGMDMAICTWNKLNNTLEFAGANNKLWIIRKGALVEYAGDKMPVGNYHGELKPFTLHEIKLELGDQIILSTDGFADQFGGEGSKKLMSKNLKSFIVNNSNLMLQQQKELLYNFLQEWKGKNEQVDDVSIISVKVV
ncbi:MAG: tetratricopeptide repeat protein [Bacteroidia bacterium]|nr:tetratricopeptide repeat protein [Bacteroidia bacterium]